MRRIGTESASSADVGGELGAFFAAHGQGLLRFAYLLTGGRGAAAEDLLHTVLARLVARGMSGLDDPVSYARRGIVNEARSAGRHASVLRRALPKLAAAETEAEAGPGTEDRLTVLDALGALTDRERAAVVLRYYEDLPDPEIAAIVGCSRSTVRSLIHRALPKLRARLDDTYRPVADPAEGRGGDD